MEEKDPKAAAAAAAILMMSLMISALVYIVWKVFIFIFILIPPAIFHLIYQMKNHQKVKL